MMLGRHFFLLVLFFKCIDCNVIPYKKSEEEKLRFNSEPEQKRFVRQSGPEVWAVDSGAGRNNLVEFLAEDAPVAIADSINPLQVEMDVASAGNTKEKRCRQRYEPVLGANFEDGPNLNIVRRDVPMDTIRKRCENCRNSPKCKNLGFCEICERICNQFVDPAISDPSQINDQLRNARLSESLTDIQDGDSTLVAMPNRLLENEDGLSEVDDRFYTVGSFESGPVQSLLARLLRINDKSKLERFIVLAKTVSTTKPHTIDKPVVIDTAHVFTLNDGKPSPVQMELHPVNGDKNVVELTRRLNKDLDTALEHKRQQQGKTNVHLSAKEIDEIIQKAIKMGSAKVLDTERVGEANPLSEDRVGCKKKKKDKDSSEEYSNYGGYYREADSDEELGLTDRTVVEDQLKSISTRNKGFYNDGVEDADSENLRNKKKGNKKHHLTESDSNLEDVAKHDDSNKKFETDHDKPSLKEEDSKESAENDQERHKGKKKSKKHKKGGHEYRYRDAAQNNDEEINSKARSNFGEPMQAPNQQNSQEHHGEPEEEYHQYESPPALPNSYQPEDQQDNYQSEETYYSESSEEYGPESYDQQRGQGDNERYQEGENQGYEEDEQPPQKESGPQQQYEESQQPQKSANQPQAYPKPQNPVYNHPAPPVEQGTYVPKKSQYNEEPKMLPTTPEEKKQYPISQAQESESAQEEEEGPAQQEIVIPGLNVDEDAEDYIVGQVRNEDELNNQYSKSLRDDFANKTVEHINKRINKIIENSKNVTDKAQLDENEKSIDDPLVGDNNLKQFQARYNKANVLENEHGRFVAMKKPLFDSKHLTEQIVEPIIGMANIPSESKSAPFVDPKAMAHQLDMAKMVRDKNPERVGCKHKEDSSEEYGYYRRDNNEETNDAGDTVGCKKKKKKDQESEEYIMVYPQQHGYGGYRENEDIKPQQKRIVQAIVGSEQPGPSGPFTNEPIDQADAADDTVGCKKKKKDKEGSDEYIYVYPPKSPYNEYGGYRDNIDGSDRKKPLEKVKEVLQAIVHPSTAKAEKTNQSVVQKVKETTELPKAILPGLIEGIKQLRNHHNEEAANVNSATTEAPKENLVSPFSPGQFNRPGFRPNKMVPPQQFNSPQNQLQHRIMPPPRGPNIHSPIEDNLAMLEAFHNQQNQQQQQFFPIVGASMDHGHNIHPTHEDTNFGQMIPLEHTILPVENREVNEKTQMFFVGDGIKLPIHVKKQVDGTMHLSIDVAKLCQCNNVTCTNAVEGLANLVPTLEKLNHGKVELEVNEDSFNSALNNLNQMEDHGHLNDRQQFGDRSKRSPQAVTMKPLLEEVGELSTSDSGELVAVFDDEKYDEISTIRKYYTGDLANDLHNLKDNIQMYYDNEDKFKDYMGGHKKNEGFFADFILKRVELLTNVLSWMKSIAIDEAKQQHHVDE